MSSSNAFRLPSAPNSIQKGKPLKLLLGGEAVDCLAHNICLVHSEFDVLCFRELGLNGLEPLGILDRAKHLAGALRACLPQTYSVAIKILLQSLTPAQPRTADLGLAVFFYLPHVYFVSTYGLNKAFNRGKDPFEISMKAQYELTRRFSAEFSMRPFLIEQQERTLDRLMEWTTDPDPHVRRLCSEGSRPRLPWAARIPAFIRDPTPVIPILEALKDDPELYVRRSVANHLGDIAKDNLEVAYALCERWLTDASDDRRWLIRHALRHPAKLGQKRALRLRLAAK
jgi:3-methyladenine DNA glycosylase AlkC